MEDSGAILCQIAIFKDILDQMTREIEPEIVKRCQMESDLFIKEAELTKSFLASRFEVNGLTDILEANLRKSQQLLKEKISRLYSELFRRLTEKRNNETEILLSEKKYLENEVRMLDEKNETVKNSILVYMEDEMRNFSSEFLD